MCFNALWICWTVNSTPLFYTALCTVQCGASNTMQWNTVGQCLVQGTLQQCNKFMADISYSAPPSTVNSWTSCDASQISEQFTVTSCDASLHLSLGLIGQYALLMRISNTLHRWLQQTVQQVVIHLKYLQFTVFFEQVVMHHCISHIACVALQGSMLQPFAHICFQQIICSSNKSWKIFSSAWKFLKQEILRLFG